MDIEKLKEIKNKICRNERKKITVKSLGKILPKKKEFPVLKNERGNFCFVNAFTQLLYSMDSFMDFILKVNFDNLIEDDKKLLNSLQEYYKNIQTKNYNKEKFDVYKTNIENLIQDKSNIISGKQNDSTEVLLSLFNKLFFYEKKNNDIKKFFNSILIKQKEEFYFKNNKNNNNNKIPFKEQYNDSLCFQMDYDLILNYYQYNNNEITKIDLTKINIVNIEELFQYLQNPTENKTSIQVNYNTYRDGFKKTTYIVSNNNKYIIITNNILVNIIYNENRTITLKDENNIDVSYKLLGFIAHHGEIDYKTSSSSGGHYVYYYTNNNDIQLLDDGKNTPLSNDDLIKKHKKDYERPYLLLYERVPIIDNLPSGGSYKINKNNKIKNNNSNKSKYSKKSKYSNKHKRSNKKISRHNKKYN